MRSKFIQSFATYFPLKYVILKNNEISCVADKKDLVALGFFIKHSELMRFEILVDICVVDYLSVKNRFEVVYHFLSVYFNQRMRLKVYLSDISSITTLTSVYRNASWWEREAWDLFGVFFSEHPDLRRILTDYGFVGHPFRKDFPLVGYFDLRYSAFSNCIVYDKTVLAQDFRQFSYLINV